MRLGAGKLGLDCLRRYLRGFPSPSALNFERL
jgi:hypothetical protein